MAEPQVLIVGAGPTGLALAAELARFGLSFRLIDRSPLPAQWSQALVVQARTLEQFERYGIAETAVARGRKIGRATILSDRQPIVRFDFDRIPSRYPFVLFLPQSDTERLLTEHLHAVGGQIERKVEFVALHQHDDHVEATFRHADGQLEQVSAAWLVGCDGAHSMVRHVLGVPFAGNSVDFVFFLGDMHLAGPDLPGDELRVYLQHGNIVFLGRLSETVYRVIVALRAEQQQAPIQDERAVTIDDFQHGVDTCVGPQMRVRDPTWITRFRINQRKAQQYRVGRAFLAGDASHIHSPVAGQGMNTGIQDVANLAWKLAAVAHGVPEALLDTYNEERGAVGDALVATTSRGLAAALTANPILEAVRDHVIGPLTELPFVRRQALGFISETAVHYRQSSIVQDCGGGSALRAGDRAPDVTFQGSDGKLHRLYERVAAPDHLLIALDCADTQVRGLADIWPAQDIIHVSSAAGEAFARIYSNRGKPVLYALRPDGYIGFRGSPADTTALCDYAQRVGVADGEVR